MNATVHRACLASVLLALVPAAFSQSAPSFGPNGTHWPSNTPKPGAAIPNVLEVDCTWAAIKAAITAATDAQVEEGYHIKVAPGNLPGNGSGSGSPAVLSTVGKTGLSKNILITPRDGWGTITITAGARILAVKGVTFARFNGHSVRFQDCPQTNWAQSKMSLGIYMQASGIDVTNCNFYEIVIPDSAVSSADRMGFAAGNGRTISNCVIEGVYVAPLFRAAGSSAHMDTLQMYGNGIYRGLTLRDSVLFGSANCAMQLGGVKASDPNVGTPFFTMEHTLLTSLSRAIALRYPQLPDSDVPSLSQAINGAGEPWHMYASDSIVLGSMYTTKWNTVTNSRANIVDVATKHPATTGGWVYDPALSSWGPADLDAVAPHPTDAYLASIWNDDADVSGIIAYEGFSYAASSAINGSADSETDIGWTGVTWGSTSDVVSPGLTYPGYPSEGNAVQFTSGVAAARTPDASLYPEGYGVTGSDGVIRLGASGSTLWIAFLLRPDLTDVDLTKYTGLHLVGATTGGSYKLSIGENGTNQNWSVAKGSTIAASESPVDVGTTTLLVTRIKFVPGSLNDEVDLFVNPPLGASEPTTPSAALRGVDIGSFHRVEFKATRKSTGDEVALGVDWASVTGQ